MHFKLIIALVEDTVDGLNRLKSRHVGQPRRSYDIPSRIDSSAWSWKLNATFSCSSSRSILAGRSWKPSLRSVSSTRIRVLVSPFRSMSTMPWVLRNKFESSAM